MTTSQQLARLAIFFAVVFSCSPSSAAKFIDFFTSGLDTMYWEITSNQSLYTVDDSSGDIQIGKPAGGNYEFQAAHIRFRPEVHGDFNVSVDFRDAYINRVDGKPGNQVQLNVSFGDQDFDVVRSDEIGIDHNYHVWIEPPAVLQGIQTETAFSGTLRIIRTGTTVTGYFNTTEIFSDDYSSDIVTFLSFSLQNNGTKDSTSVTFDNFYLTADSLSLPPLSGLKDPGDLPTLATLEAFPNPFGERTRIEYSLSAAGPVHLAIFDVAGRRIAILDGGYRNRGAHSEYWNGETQRGAKAPTGIYFAKLAFQGEIVTRKIVLLQ